MVLLLEHIQSLGSTGGLPSSHGLNGSHGTVSTSCPPLHAACPKVPAEPRPVSAGVPPDQGAGVPGTLQSPFMVERFTQYSEGECSRTSSLSPTGLHRHILSRLGRCPRRLWGQQTLARSLGGSAYKRTGAESCSPRTLTVSAEVESSPFHCQDRQHSGSSIHQQAGGSRLPHLMQATKLWQWAHPLFCSLRAIHVLGLPNMAADILSRGGSNPGEWRLYP